MFDVGVLDRAAVGGRGDSGDTDVWHHRGVGGVGGVVDGMIGRFEAWTPSFSWKKS